MILLWKVRYFDSQNKAFKFRGLTLDLGTLDPVTKAQIEIQLALENKNLHRGGLLKFRHLFIETEINEAWLKQCVENKLSFNFCSMPESNYIEDELGRPLSQKQLALAITGSEDAICIPPGAKQHDIEYSFAPKTPIPFGDIELSEASLSLLGYFVRDLREMTSSTFFREGPGTLETSTDISHAHLRTAASEEEVRSFATVFRRLYMENEPANLVKSTELVASSIGSHPFAKWLREEVVSYQKDLASGPHMALFINQKQYPYSSKQTIDLFLYTHIAHQPNEDKIKRRKNALEALGWNEELLTYLMLAQLYYCAINMRNLGIRIEYFYEVYCQMHKTRGSIINSLIEISSGFGEKEKRDQLQDRIIKEQAAKLGHLNWDAAGNPPNQLDKFINDAYDLLVKDFPQQV